MPILTPTEDLNRILVSRTDGLGDVIVTLPVAVALKERLPDVEVAFLVRPYTAPIVQRIAEIDRVLTISKLRRGLHVMRIYKPDAIVFARPEFKLALEALIARIDVRIGTGYRLYSGLFTRWVYEHRRSGQKHEAEYSVNLLGPLLDGPLPVRMPQLGVSRRGANEASERLGALGVGGEYLVVHPGSHGSASMYSAESYAAVIDALLADRDGLTVIVTAGPGEEPIADDLFARVRSKERVRIVSGLSLDALSELLRGARGFLGSSSGPIHLAALVRTPVVGLYPGLPPMWPARWEPLGEHVTTLVPHAEEPFCPLCEKKHQPENCVRRIAVDRVVEACRGMLIGKDAGMHDYIV